MAVDIGSDAIDRGNALGGTYTSLLKDIPASESGTLTSIEIWASEDMSGLKVGVFYLTAEDTFKCRSAATIAGTILAGSKVTKAVSLAMEVDDLLGLYWADGKIELDTSGGSGRWYRTGDHIIVDDEEEYTSLSNQILSLGGHLPAAAAGHSFGFIIG